MNTMMMLAASSIAWGAVLCVAGLALQRNSNVSGRARQWIWRGATLLLLAPWVAAPVVSALGLGLAQPDVMAAHGAEEPTAELVSAAAGIDAANGKTAVVENGGGLLAWLGGLNWAELALAALIIGWVVRFVTAQLALRSLLGIVSRSRAAEPGPATMALAGWTQKLGLRRTPRMRIVQASVSPFSCGVLRPVIYLPEGIEDRLSAEALDLVVGHETLHIARGDGWRRPLERVTADIFWFNPFAWQVRRELDVARELACDEGVVELSSARQAYARTLRDVAGFSAGLSQALPAASMSLAGGRSLALRVTRTLAMAKRRPARVVVIAACLLGVAGAPIALAQVMLATPAPPAPPAGPPAPMPVAEQIYLMPDGTVRASFPARATSIHGTPATGYSLILEALEPNQGGEACIAHLTGLGALSVKANQSIARGEVIGARGQGAGMNFTLQCSTEVDTTGGAISEGPPPAPPAPPPEPVAPVAPVPPAAPVALAAPASAVAPLAAPAPITAPLAAARPLSRPAPSPLAVPAPPAAPLAPLGWITPPAPTTPLTAPTPPTPPTSPPPVTPPPPSVAPSLDGDDVGAQAPPHRRTPMLADEIVDRPGRSISIISSAGETLLYRGQSDRDACGSVGQAAGSNKLPRSVQRVLRCNGRPR